MDILEKNTNIVFSGVLDYSSCDNITSFESDKRKDYELYKTLISKFINTKYTVFLKESDVNKKNVLQKIYAALNNQESKDLFIFYFTGHGILSNNGEPGLLMSDSSIITKTLMKSSVWFPWPCVLSKTILYVVPVALCVKQDYSHIKHVIVYTLLIITA